MTGIGTAVVLALWLLALARRRGRPQRRARALQVTPSSLTDERGALGTRVDFGVSDTPSAHRGRRHPAGSTPWGALGRDCAVASASTAVVALLVAYALTSPSFKLETAVAPVHAHTGRQAVVHGRVLEGDGDALAGVEVRVGPMSRIIGAARSGERGYFRIDLSGPCSVYRIELVAPAHGTRVHEAFRHRLCPGDALEIDARLVATSQMIWMPTR